MYVINLLYYIAFERLQQSQQTPANAKYLKQIRYTTSDINVHDVTHCTQNIKHF